jgi:hypothetical protein
MNAQVMRELSHEVWHVGRGGAGNRSSQKARKMSNESEESNGSVRSGFFERLSDAFDRR